MYERKNQVVISKQQFNLRMLKHLLIVIALLLFSLAMGMIGYRVLEHFSWMDGFLNSAMLLGGMGPVNPPKTEAGKLFAGVYALYAGLIFIFTAGLIFTPMVHRLMHQFNWEDDDESQS